METRSTHSWGQFGCQNPWPVGPWDGPCPRPCCVPFLSAGVGTCSLSCPALCGDCWGGETGFSPSPRVPSWSPSEPTRCLGPVGRALSPGPFPTRTAESGAPEVGSMPGHRAPCRAKPGLFAKTVVPLQGEQRYQGGGCGGSPSGARASLRLERGGQVHSRPFASQDSPGASHLTVCSGSMQATLMFPLLSSLLNTPCMTY